MESTHIFSKNSLNAIKCLAWYPNNGRYENQSIADTYAKKIQAFHIDLHASSNRINTKFDLSNKDASITKTVSGYPSSIRTGNRNLLQERPQLLIKRRPQNLERNKRNKSRVPRILDMQKLVIQPLKLLRERERLGNGKERRQRLPVHHGGAQVAQQRRGGVRLEVGRLESRGREVRHPLAGPIGSY